MLGHNDMVFVRRRFALEQLDMTTDTRLMNRVNDFPLPGTGSIAHAISNPAG